MIKPILQIGDPILETVCEDVALPITPDILEIITDLKDTLASTGELGAGLSAPQIGITKRIAIVKNIDIEMKIRATKSFEAIFRIKLNETTVGDILKSDKTSIYLKYKDEKFSNADQRNEIVSALEKYLEFSLINPVVEYENEYETFYWEGCLSVGVGDDALYAPVARSEIVRLTYVDLNGASQKMEAKDYFAHVVLHEIDHLNGKLFLSRVKDITKIWKSKALDVYYKENGKYPPFE